MLAVADTLRVLFDSKASNTNFNLSDYFYASFPSLPLRQPHHFALTMAAIRALLNPAISVNEDREPRVDRKLPPRLFRPIKSTGLSDIPSSPSPRKKQKIVKDQPVFTRGPPRGEVRYPPFEYDNPSLFAYHQQFDMFPMEDIGAYPRHIPYNSEKKLFQEKTGRDFFEVYQYQFKMPGSEQSYTLLWDYNIGLTTPAKMLNRNVGLREICHSITGGSLVAQGYWIPYEAARAVAATFCWDIRYVLTPVFGIEFLDMCVPPDSEKYGLMLIDPKITKLCTEQAREYRQLELANPPPGPRCALPSPPLPNTPVKVVPYLRFKAINDDTSSEHATETSDNDRYTLSPGSPVPFRHPWYSGNPPRSARRHDDELISPKSVMSTIKTKAVAERDRDIEIESSAAIIASSYNLRGLCDRIAVDEGYDGDSSDIVIELHGLEFEIANAAFQAGFNTANHEALFNLIWALKRAGNRCFGSSGQSRLGPPKNSIYPDRYRPSGIGDNTMKKRKLTAASNPQIHSIPLLQKGNTKDDPIELDDNPSPGAHAAVRGLTSTRKSAEAVARVKRGMNNNSQDRAMDVDEFAKECVDDVDYLDENDRSIFRTSSRASTTRSALSRLESRATGISRRQTVLSRIRSRPPIGNFTHALEHAKTSKDYLVDFDGPDDPYRPVNWPLKKKVITTLLYALATMTATWASATFSAGSEQFSQEFHVASEVAVLGTALFLFGFGTGPLLFAPLSEVFGRKYAVLPPLFISACFSFATATAKDIQTVMICRFFTGFFASAPVTNTGGVLADLFPSSQRGIAIAAYAMAVVIGPVFGPVVGAAMVVNSSLGWRWTMYLDGIMTIFILVLDTIFIDESYPPALLVAKARRLRFQSGNWALHAKFEEWDVTLSELSHKFLVRPFQILQTPIAACMCLYASFCYGILYMNLGAIPIIFYENRGWDLLPSELPFLAIAVGACVGAAINILNQFNYNKQAHGRVVPELRLFPMMLGSVIFAAGIFITGWTADPKYPWIAPVIGIVMMGSGFFTIFQAALNYLSAIFEANFIFFSYHPILQSAGILLLTQSILVLQPTSTPKHKRDGTWVHATLNALGFAALTAGLVVIELNKASHPETRFTSVHGILGLVTFILIGLQALVGVVQYWLPWLVGGVENGKAIYKYHRISGYIILLLALATIITATKTNFNVNVLHIRLWTVIVASLLVVAGVAARVKKHKFGL
ncbi:hypothetical protein DV737_g4461, partial [Chaetothyriales sp. CBS 132003]